MRRGLMVGYPLRDHDPGLAGMTRPRAPPRWNNPPAAGIPMAMRDSSGAQRFGELVVPHLTALYCTALRLVGKPHDAEDLVQETCLRAFRALDQLREPAAAKVWVFTVLRSVFLRRAERDVPGRTISVDDPDSLSYALPALAW